ncbi:hypothetical protein DPMN_141563 [Dreissena polymorpha]|uniref:Uncharacterized protein n=1 Tax=Dreissena polymorpha TaxID=45954 RepID=A0A9D4G9Y1_DREPO|nr:hypothetical protein DPMN_141563 [Dreissena polymorpha]
MTAASYARKRTDDDDYKDGHQDPPSDRGPALDQPMVDTCAEQHLPSLGLISCVGNRYSH